MRKFFTLIVLFLSFLYGRTQNNCQAYFYAQTTAGITSVNFNDYSYNTDSTMINVLSWQWSFGDGSTSTSQNPQYTYANPGTYYVCLAITTPTCTSTFCDSVYITGISSGCQAYFNVYPDTSCSTCYYFNDASTGTGLSYYWSFGDNTSSTSQYPYHQYNTIGTYYTCLTISNGSGCQDTYCDTVFVGTSPVNCNAQFYAYPDTFSNTTFNFYDYSTGNPYSWLWNFGDGTSSTSQYPSHTYLNSGTYTVCLTITTANCVDTFCNVVAVNPQNSCLLYATYTTTPESYSGAANGSIDVTVNGGSAPYTYYWTNGATTQDIFNLAEGYYDLSVTDSAGCSTFLSVYVPDTSTVYIPVGTLSNLPVDTCLQFSYDTVYVYNLDVIDSTHIAVTWIFLEISTGTTAYMTDTFSISGQGYYTVSITISCNQKSYTQTYYDHVYVDYNDISLSVNNSLLSKSTLDIFPNPFNENIYLNYNSAGNSNIRVKLLNIAGRTILERNFNVIKGMNNLSFNTAELKNGMYFVRVISGNKIYNRKIVK